ncbi:MFS transporter [Actinomadura sp. J1-007]|nr:MFS transporter [Actinomadura sp. J1-007]
MSTDDAQGWRRDFRLLWGGSAFSHLGTVSAATASPLLALSLTGSPVFAGWVTAASAVPGLLLHVPAGWLADRADRRRIMQASQAARCLSTALFVLGFTLLGNPWLLLVAVLADGACATFYSIAESAAVRHIVPPGSRRSAIAKNEARLHIAQFIGRPLGGFLFGVGHLIPYIFDALSSFVSFRAIARMRTGDFHPFRMRRTVPEAAPTALAAPAPLPGADVPHAKPVPAASSAPATPPHSVTAQIETAQCKAAHAMGSPGAEDDGWDDGWEGEGEGLRGATFRSGVSLVARDPFLRTVLVVCGIANFLLQTTLLLMVVLAKEHGTSSAAIGFLLATSGVGGVLGALVAPRVLQRLSPPAIVRACVWSWLVLLAVVAVAHDPVVGLVAWGSCSFMGAHVNVALAAHQASAVPKRLQGQVMGLTRFATGGAIPLGALCGGYVIAGLDPALTAWLAVAVMALVVLGVSMPLAARARRCAAVVRWCAG